MDASMWPVVCRAVQRAVQMQASCMAVHAADFLRKFCLLQLRALCLFPCVQTRGDLHLVRIFAILFHT